MTWSTVRETSRAAEVWRRLAVSSVAVSRVRRLAPPIRRRVRPLTRDVQRPASASELDGLLCVADDSVVLRAATRVIAGGLTDWRESYGGRQAVRLTRLWRGLDRMERIRLAAIALFVAVVTHLAMTRFRAPDSTLIARVVWALILAGLTWVIAEAQGLLAAWTDWSRRWRR